MTNIRRALATTTAILMAAAGSLMVTAPNAQAAIGPAIFFSPHQDDEVLSFGAAITEHVRAGRQVIVVLMSDGGSSAACIPYWGSRAACVAGRDQEFINGVTALGGTPVISPTREVDGNVTIAGAKATILSYYAQYPTGSFKTMSEFDASPDHSNIGKALRQTGIYDARYYIKHSEWTTHAGTFSMKYDTNTAVNMYPFGKASVPNDFYYATYPVGNQSKVYS